MYKVSLNNKTIEVPAGTILSDVLNDCDKILPHICGGKGVCKKCLVLINGEEKLSCQYRVQSDISVVVPENTDIFSESVENASDNVTKDCCFCLDIGTTTLALALVSLDEKKIIKAKTSTNPQIVFGGDVLNRIDYCNKNGVFKLQKCLIEAIKQMIEAFGVTSINKMYVSGNTTMLHIFFGIAPSSMGAAPYTPNFLDSKEQDGYEIGLRNIEKVVSLPCVSAFVGADLVAGVNFVGLPDDNKYNLLVDLGTNAEIVLYNKYSLCSTSAAAGPCFEGANITCGMSAVDGAIYSYKIDGSFETINNKAPKGICGTGLIDIIAVLLEKGIIDETGYMECEEFFITDTIKLTQKDIRQFQLAKSAVYSGISAILNEKTTSFSDIENLFISGGFSAKINIGNVVKTGLLPKELKDRIIPLNNTSLLGTVKFAFEQNDLTAYTKNSEYIDLSTNSFFSNLFIENMEF